MGLSCHGLEEAEPVSDVAKCATQRSTALLHHPRDEWSLLSVAVAVCYGEALAGDRVAPADARASRISFLPVSGRGQRSEKSGYRNVAAKPVASFERTPCLVGKGRSIRRPC